jgi:hypothetical protein
MSRPIGILYSPYHLSAETVVRASIRRLAESAESSALIHAASPGGIAIRTEFVDAPFIHSPALTAECLLPVTAIAIGNIATTRVISQLVTARREARAMTAEPFDREKKYQISMAIARSMLRNGLITHEEYQKIDVCFRDKYQPILGQLLA